MKARKMNLHRRPDPAGVVSRPRLAGRQADVDRIARALKEAKKALRPFTAGRVGYREKSERGDPVTAADRAVDEALRKALPYGAEGWLSEESADDASRVSLHRVWVVDPLDGTREFTRGIPEWCVSIGLVEGGVPVAGGVLNPATGDRILGALETGITLNGEPARGSERRTLEGATVLASRTEVERGEWERWDDAPFEVVPCGSVAWKLARVAAGLADATWTLSPKNEWDVAAGVALVTAAGGVAVQPDGAVRRFNRHDPLLPGLVAGPAGLIDAVREDWI